MRDESEPRFIVLSVTGYASQKARESTSYCVIDTAYAREVGSFYSQQAGGIAEGQGTVRSQWNRRNDAEELAARLNAEYEAWLAEGVA